jgi:hypothetical protein
MTFCTTVATFSMSLLNELGICTDRPISEFPVVTDAAALGPTHFSHLSAEPVVAGVASLDALQLHSTALVR